MHKSQQSNDLPSRIRLLASIQAVLTVLVVVADLLARTDQWWLPVVLALLGLGVTALLDSLRYTRYAALIVYADLILTQLLLAAADPLSGRLAGSNWVLFQLWPPVAVLVLRRPQAALWMCIATLVLLVGSVTLQLTAVFPVYLVVPRTNLTYHLWLQAIVLVSLSAVIARLGQREQQALSAALEAQAQAQAQLAMAQGLAAEKDQLNQVLVQRLAEVQQRDQQLVQQQVKEEQLYATIQTLSAPILPVLPGVLVAPLIGNFTAARATVFAEQVLQAVEEQRTQYVILDVTSLPLLDMATATVLQTLALSVQLLGCQVLLVGVRPEVAQTIIGLSVSLPQIQTYANLQAAVAALTR